MAQTDSHPVTDGAADPADARALERERQEALERERRERRRAKADRRAELQQQEEEKKLARVAAFVHIPETPGGSVKTVLSETYGADAIHIAGDYLSNPRGTVETAKQTQPGHRLTIGHVPYGIFYAVLPLETRCLTFLREPVERVVSHYHRHLDGKVVLEEALEREMPDVTNLMTRFLCGHPEILGALPETAVEDAKENLRTFTFVGFQERFDESIVLLRRKLRLPVTADGAGRQVTDDPPSSDDVGAEKLELIRAHNQLDIELYAWAVEHFAPQFEAGADIDTAVPDRRDAGPERSEEQEKRVAQALEWLRKAAPPGSTRSFEELRVEAEAAGVTNRELAQARRQMPAKKVRSGDGFVLVVDADAPAGTGGEAA